jgi:hypothetical protein
MTKIINLFFKGVNWQYAFCILCFIKLTLPTKPLYSVQDPEGEVALCTLSAVNLGALESIDELDIQRLD